jgi:hypothetical protein
MWLELSWNGIHAGGPVQNVRPRELQGLIARGTPAVFFNLTDAREKTEHRRRDYNQNRVDKRTRRLDSIRVSEPTRWRLFALSVVDRAEPMASQAFAGAGQKPALV